MARLLAQDRERDGGKPKPGVVATKTAYGFVVIDSGQKFVRTEILPGGKTRTKEIKIEGVSPETHPALAAAYVKDGCYDVDMQAGVCRFHGRKTGAQLARLLRSAGLGGEAKGLLRHARAAKAGCAPHFY